MLRARDGGEQRVTPLELFFDLVYVFAIIQLSHLLPDHPTVGGALQTLFLLLVAWWAWVYTTWFTNWFDPEAPLVRLMLVAVMLASLVMSVAIPGAFGERGLMFALAYVAIQVGRTGFVVVALAGSPGASDRTSRDLAMTYRRILCWFAASGVLWVAGSLLEGGARYALWMLALAVDYAGPVARYKTPSLGRSRTGLDHRGQALRREVPALRHHRPRRVDPGHRHHLRRGRDLRRHVRLRLADPRRRCS